MSSKVRFAVEPNLDEPCILVQCILAQRVANSPFDYSVTINMGTDYGVANRQDVRFSGDYSACIRYVRGYNDCYATHVSGHNNGRISGNELPVFFKFYDNWFKQ